MRETEVAEVSGQTVVSAIAPLRPSRLTARAVDDSIVDSSLAVGANGSRSLVGADDLVGSSRAHIDWSIAEMTSGGGPEVEARCEVDAVRMTEIVR